MSRHSEPYQETKVDLAPPDIIGTLPPIDGGEENLLLKDAWLHPLRIKFPIWSEPAPQSGFFDIVQLFFGRGSDPVHERQLEGPITDTELWLEVPAKELNEGVHVLYYRLLPWNGSTPRECRHVNVTIDKSPPILAADSKLIFPPEVLPPNKLTAHYLEGDDLLRAGIRAYSGPKPGDAITWYWDRSSSGATVGGTKVLTVQDFDKPLTLDITGDWIREQGDGDRYAWYRVTDRAGNTSGQSAVQKLDVAAQPTRGFYRLQKL
ncbi:hypothetical protein IMF27_04190 [Pseudomonas sp. PCH199]|uniref:hypothetical protein n=1 Tax=unclassified Pseudomonas TaxID=196821 RepID=UPI000BD50C34|nr:MULTISPECIES: hypothetical protein [unclassified Pseudomonas]MCW8274996.1 hypothetical protein [Pseudomonas sp. PCH199]PAM84675.1 hypothetical protein CES87_04290 [Pseudomonas sp. ERMR1:02]